MLRLCKVKRRQVRIKGQNKLKKLAGVVGLPVGLKERAVKGCEAARPRKRGREQAAACHTWEVSGGSSYRRTSQH